MNLHIIKSKIILLFNKVTYFVLFISIVYCYIYINFNICNSKYSLESNDFSGIVKKIVNKENSVDIYLDDLLVKVYNELDFEIREGMKIKVYGECEYPEINQNKNLFNYRNYLKSKNINYIVRAKSIIIVDDDISLFYKIKNKIRDIINESDNKEYLFAFILGDSTYLDDSIRKRYQFIGVSHLFAVSGMHISFLTSFINKLLNKLQLSEIYIFLITGIFLLIYTFLTSFSPSIMRASILYCLCLIKKKLNLKISTRYLVMLLFSIFLLINPYYIYNVGFLFSYIITYFLIMNGKLINSYKKYATKILITSIISFFASIPLLINNYFSINLLTPFFNVIFIPLVSFIIFPFAFLSLIIPFFSQFFLNFIKIMELIAILLSEIKIFNITLSHISINIIIFYYIVIIFVINKIYIKEYKYILFLFALLFFHHNIKYFDSYFTVNFINIGQGDSILMTLPYNKGNILIDSGGNRNYNLSENVLIPFFKSVGITKLDYIIITHGDFDHMGEAINLVNNFKVEKVIFNCGPHNDLEKELIKVLDKKRIKYYSCIKELNIDKNKLYFLQTKEYDNENDNSNVIYTELDGYKFMFMGDASTTSEKEILNKYNLPDIDVLKVGHHGSKTSSSKSFINEINPKYSVISVGKNNRYGHPNKEVLEKLEDSKIYRTDQNGSIMFKIKNNKLKIETCSQ